MVKQTQDTPPRPDAVVEPTYFWPNTENESNLLSEVYRLECEVKSTKFNYYGIGFCTGVFAMYLLPYIF